MCNVQKVDFRVLKVQKTLKNQGFLRTEGLATSTIPMCKDVQLCKSQLCKSLT